MCPLNDKLTKLPASPPTPISVGFKRYFANTSWIFGEKILRMIVGLFVGIWVARYLGPERFGLLSYAMSFVGLFTAFATLGLDGIVVRELIRDESESDVLLGTVFWLKLLGAFVVLIVLGFAIQFTSNDQYTNNLIFIIGSATIFQSFNVIDFYFQSKVLSKYVVLANIISLSLSSVIKVALILNEAPLVAFAIMVVFDSLILAIGFLYFYLHKGFFLKAWKFDVQKAKELLRDSFPLMIAFLSTSISLKIDQVIIKNILDAKAVGYYAGSIKIVGLFYFIPVALTTSLFPSIVKSYVAGNNFEKRIQALSSLLTLIALCIMFVLCLFNYFIIEILLGQEYLMSAKIMPFHAISLLFIFNFSIRKKILLVENMTSYILFYAIITSISMVICVYIFTTYYGVIGAAMGYLFAWGLSLSVVPFFLGRPKEVTLFLKSFNFFLLYKYLKSLKSTKE